MEKLFKRTFTENTSRQTLEIKDLGSEKLTKTELSALFSIVNFRYEHRLPIITYTRHKAAELIERISVNEESSVLAHAIVGRLWEMEVRPA